MEWKEFILIFFGGFMLIVFLLTAQSIFFFSKLESVNVSIMFQIDPDTQRLINSLQNKSSLNNCDVLLLNQSISYQQEISDTILYYERLK